MITGKLTRKKIQLNPALYKEIEDITRNISRLFNDIGDKRQQLLNNLPAELSDQELNDYNKAVSDIEENSQEALEIKRLQALGRIKIEELQNIFFSTYTNKEQVIESCKEFINDIEKADFANYLKGAKARLKQLTDTLTKEQAEKLQAYTFIDNDSQEDCFKYFSNLDDYYLLEALCQNKKVDIKELNEPLLNKIASFYPKEKPLTTKAILNIFGEATPETSYTPKRIYNSIFLLDKVTDKTFSESMMHLTLQSLKQGGKGTVAVDVAGKEYKAKKENVIVAVNINYAGLGESAKDLTRADQEVYNAICTFYESENYFFTLDSLYREITGNKTARLTEAKKEELRNAIHKFMSILIQIDNSDEAVKYNLATVTTATTNLCHITEVKEKTLYNGAVVNEGYLIMGEPILLSYARIRKQLATINKKYLPKVRENEVTIRQYLIREIELMKGKAHRTNILSYKTIYEYEHIDKSNRKKTSATRDKVKKILDSFKNTGYIYDYKEKKKNNSVDSIEIYLTENSEKEEAVPL